MEQQTHRYDELAARRADVRALLDQLDRAEGKARFDLFTVLGEQQYAIHCIVQAMREKEPTNE